MHGLTMTQLLEWVIGIYVIMFVMFAIFLFFWIKWHAKGKVAAVFMTTRRISSTLAKEDTENTCIWIGKDSDPNREKYKLIPEKSFEIKWPSGLPWFFQERLRAWIFTRNNDEPWDPSNMRVTMSARMNRMVSDEALLKTMWRDIRIATTGAGAVGTGLNMKLLLFIGFGILVSAMGAVLTYNVSKELATVYKLLLSTYHLLGGK